jgi:hypothetical protein
MQQRMSVLAGPQNRVERITDRMTFKERCGVVRGGGAQLQNGKARTGWDGMGWRRVPGIETENEKLKRTIPF